MSSGGDERSRLADALKRAFSTRMPAAQKSTAVSTGISFTPELLRAVLDGQKTQTRRPIRPVPTAVVGGTPCDERGVPIACPYRVGESLWVREKWARAGDGSFVYAFDPPPARVRWIASRYMPRAAARFGLRVDRVGAERLGAITDDAAQREGVDQVADQLLQEQTPRERFFVLWDAIYGETEFAAKCEPWVWVVEFALVRLKGE